MIGFLEESEGVRSMSRLVMLLLTVFSGLLAVALAMYILRPSPSAEVVCAVGGALVTFVIHGAVAIINRNGGNTDER